MVPMIRPFTNYRKLLLFSSASAALILSLLLSACQMGYLIKSAYYQADLLANRVPIERVLANSTLDNSVRQKLLLSQDARNFAVAQLGLNGSHNYQTYVELKQPYVTYAVSAAPKFSLEHHLWSFPIVGSVPYKGFFKLADAQSEESALKTKDLDTYLRGVSAYSTLGWFNDPILSSMIRYDDYDLVNLIIHETVHATIYIRSQADFNEQLATFIGDQGTEMFFLEREGPQSNTLKMARERSHDTKLFSDFISKEIEALKTYYQTQAKLDENSRRQKFAEIKGRFTANVRPQLKTDSFANFEKSDLNNARLLAMQTYMKDLSQFARAFHKLERDFKKFMDFCHQLEKSDDPATTLAQFIGVSAP